MTTSSLRSDLSQDTAWVHRLARRLLDDSADAEDLAQDVLLEACRRPEAARSSRRGWLAGVARNLAARRHRRAAERARLFEVVPAPACEADPTADTVARLEVRATLLQAVLALDEPYRSTVVQRFLEDLSPQQIAEREGVSPATVYTRLSRAMEQLKTSVERKFPRASLALALAPASGGGDKSLVTTGEPESSVARLGFEGLFDLSWKVKLAGMFLLTSTGATSWLVLRQPHPEKGGAAIETVAAGSLPSIPANAGLPGVVARRVEEADASRAPMPVVLSEDPADLAIRGTVVDIQGRPLIAARVLWTARFAKGGWRRSEARSDAKGHFVVAPFDTPHHEIPRGEPVPEYTATLVAVDAQGQLGWAMARGVSAGAANVKLQLSGPRWMSVSLEDSSGESVHRFAAVLIELDGNRWSADGSLPQVDRELVLSELARQRLMIPPSPASPSASTPLPPGQEIRDHGEEGAKIAAPFLPFLVVALTAHRMPAWAGPFMPEQSPEKVELQLASCPVVVGRVLASSKPVVGARVELSEVPDGPGCMRAIDERLVRSSACERTSITDEDGTFSLAIQPGRHYQLRTQVEGYAAALSQEFEAPSDARDVAIDLPLSAGGTLVLTLLLPPGESAEGVRIVAHRGDRFPQFRTFDASAQMVLERLTPGPWMIEQASEGSETSSHLQVGLPDPVVPRWNCELQEGELSAHTLDFREGLTCEVRGIIRIDRRVVHGRFGLASVLWGRPLLCFDFHESDEQGRFSDYMTRPGASVLLFLPEDKVYEGWRIAQLRDLPRGKSRWQLDVQTSVVEGRLPERLRESKISARVVAELATFAIPISSGPDGTFRATVPVGFGGLVEGAADITMIRRALMMQDPPPAFANFESKAGELTRVDFDHR